MYHYIVRSKVRSTWKRIDAGDLDAPWRIATEDLHFTFVGDNPWSRDVVGRDEFRTWLRGVVAQFASINFTVDDVSSTGWPWHTKAAVRLTITGTLLDGRDYHNVASQWITLRWGKMTRDWVLEDTLQLARALESGRAA